MVTTKDLPVTRHPRCSDVAFAADHLFVRCCAVRPLADMGFGFNQLARATRSTAAAIVRYRRCRTSGKQNARVQGMAARRLMIESLFMSLPLCGPWRCQPFRRTSKAWSVPAYCIARGAMWSPVCTGEICWESGWTGFGGQKNADPSRGIGTVAWGAPEPESTLSAVHIPLSDFHRETHMQMMPCFRELTCDQGLMPSRTVVPSSLTPPCQNRSLFLLKASDARQVGRTPDGAGPPERLVLLF